MALKYLEKDQKRIDKKMEDLNKKLDKLEHQAQLKRLEKKYENLKESDNPEDELMAELYEELIRLEKRAKR